MVVRNGVSWREFGRNAEIGMSYRRHLDIPDGACVFGMITRLAEVKGIDIALRALALLARKEAGKPAYLIVAGDGPDREKLGTLARELDVESRVRFVGFVTDRVQVLSSYDVILFPSRREGLPLGLLEAMAAGCVPIVTRISGMPEVVDSPQIGSVVATESPEALCVAMGEMLNMERATFLRLSRNAQENIQERFDVSECYRRIISVCGLTTE